MRATQTRGGQFVLHTVGPEIDQSVQNWLGESLLRHVPHDHFFQLLGVWDA